MSDDLKAKRVLEHSPEELFSGSAPKKRLNQWLATGICGNDISSSCLYVSAIAAVFAGVLAPVVLLAVVILLYFYKKIYTEVVEALPLNGGTYNCLLNSTSKFAAALAACMTILSYIATAVISSKTAVEYLHSISPTFGVIEGTIIVLGIFAVLAIIGITESAVVALTIFIFHMSTLKSNLVVRKEKFSSEIVDAVSKEFGVPINNIFIGAPEEKHRFPYWTWAASV